MTDKQHEADRAAAQLTNDLVSLLIQMKKTSESLAKRSKDPGEIHEAYESFEASVCRMVSLIQDELRRMAASNEPAEPKPLRRNHQFNAHRRIRRDAR